MKWTRIITSERTRHDLKGDYRDVIMQAPFFGFTEINLDDSVLLLNTAHIVSATVEGVGDEDAGR